MARGKGIIPVHIRFEKGYIPVPESGCWLWLGYLTDDGYGRISKNGRMDNAHRVSWELHHGPIPQSMYVLHKCDVPACVNPHHLFLGTCLDNIHDRTAKNRSAVGLANGRSKLAPHQVAEIKRLKGQLSHAKIGRMFGVSNTTIYRIFKGATWRDVP